MQGFGRLAAFLAKMLAVGGISVGAAVMSPQAALAAAATNPFADAVRAANDRFKDVAVAVKEGYSPIPCDSAPAGGGMGIHYVSGAHLKDRRSTSPTRKQ